MRRWSYRDRVALVLRYRDVHRVPWHCLPGRCKLAHKQGRADLAPWGLHDQLSKVTRTLQENRPCRTCYLAFTQSMSSSVSAQLHGSQRNDSMLFGLIEEVS